MIEKTDRLSLLKKNVDQRRPISKGLIRSLKEDFLIKNTYHSNAIEGNRLSIYETKAVLDDGIVIAGKSMREHLEAINHKEAILVAEEMVQQDQPLSEIVIKELHGIVLHSIDRTNAGKYREQNVIISGASHTPPDAVVVPQIHDELILLAIDEGRISDKYVAFDATHFEARDRVQAAKKKKKQVPKKHGRKPKAEREQWLKEKQAEEDARPINEKEIAIGRIKGFAFLNLHPSKD
ncbi:Fic family protein [Sporosarcina sp. P17b]|uniref:Fic family protein n=1 Tax=Sporosarcina sp. P17b TaxID=2048260 RepID=UPI000C16BF1D|nr:hypothetical protein CSV76_11120 [Sporosarcina sp. P17b]